MEGTYRGSMTRYECLIEEALAFHVRAPFTARKDTPVHRWLLIPESSSVALVEATIEKAGVDKPDFVFDPLAGSGTSAFYSMLRGISFIGGDRLADLVIAGLAKSMANKIEVSEAMSAVAAVRRQLQERVASAKDDVQTAIRGLQGALLDMNLILATRVAILAILYGSIRRMPPFHTWSINGWAKRFSLDLNMLVTDLERVHLPSHSVRTAFYHGDCLAVDFDDMIAHIGMKKGKAVGVLHTSPSFIGTAQDQSGNARFAHKLAHEALQSGLCTDLFLVRDRAVSDDALDGLLTCWPDFAKELGRTVAHVLRSYRTLCTPGSVAVIEFKNERTISGYFPMDMMICHLAEQMGFEARNILVTHYFGDDGQILYRQAKCRGGVVYLYRK